VAAGASPDGAPANHALLVQLVRGVLGRGSRGRRRITISSCSFVVTLLGLADSDEERSEIEATVRRVSGIRDVANRVRVTWE
jgi:osmotically-inducible protein OsmY